MRTLETTLGGQEEHPCKCDEKYAELVNEEINWVKRNYYELKRCYWCMKCDCHWYIEEWLVGQHHTVVITQEPKEEEE